MCGRFAQFTSGDVLEAQFEATYAGERLPARYNVAPGTPILVCRVDQQGRRHLMPVHWGLIPSWAKDRKVGYRTINARAETVTEKPAFRAAFRRRRCLIPADGFYEWQAAPGGKQPFFIRHHTGRPLAFAGLWERWTDPERGEPLESATIIVTRANAQLQPIHARMPVILDPSDYETWLDPQNLAGEPLQALLQPFAEDALISYAVSRRVNRPQEDDAGLIEEDQ